MILFSCRALQEAQDIFGVDFDYEDFPGEGEEYEDEEEDEEYEDEEGIRKTRKKTDGKVMKKKSQRKTIYEVYEPSDLERGHFTDFDEQVYAKVYAKATLKIEADVYVIVRSEKRICQKECSFDKCLYLRLKRGPLSSNLKQNGSTSTPFPNPRSQNRYFSLS